MWVCLTDSSFSQAVYIEDCLVWAKRILPQRPMGVAWPARAFKLLIGQAAHAGGSLVIEYLMDSERATVPLSQIKPLTVSYHGNYMFNLKCNFCTDLIDNVRPQTFVM